MAHKETWNAGGISAIPELPRHLVKPPAPLDNVLGLAEVPFILRCLEDWSKTFRLRQTSFIGRSYKKLRKEDLHLSSPDVSKVHCSISCVGNSIMGFKLKLVAFKDSKAPVWIDGQECKMKENPYKLEVGNIVKIGMREMWKLERHTLEETVEKDHADEIEVYEGEEDFVQIAVADSPMCQTVTRAETWMDMVALVIEMSEKDPEGDPYRQAHESNLASVVESVASEPSDESQSKHSSKNISKQSSKEGGGGVAGQLMMLEPPGDKNWHIASNKSDEMANMLSFMSSDKDGGHNVSTQMHNESSDLFHERNPNSNLEDTGFIYEDKGDSEKGFFSDVSEEAERTNSKNRSGPGSKDRTQQKQYSSANRGIPRCGDMIEILDECGMVLGSFGPVETFDEMKTFDMKPVHEVLSPGLFVRIHLNFYPPLVENCDAYLQLKTRARDLKKFGRRNSFIG